MREAEREYWLSMARGALRLRVMWLVAAVLIVLFQYFFFFLFLDCAILVCLLKAQPSHHIALLSALKFVVRLRLYPIILGVRLFGLVKLEKYHTYHWSSTIF